MPTRIALPPTVAIPAGRVLLEGAGAGAVAVPAFSIGRTPVTNSEYAHFLESPAAAEGRVALPPWWSDAAFSAPDQPVVGVTWDEAAAFCAWVSAVEGGRWRLPREAEWEHACSAGRSKPATPWGDAIPSGEIPAGPLSGPWPTGRGTPNPFGVLDPGTVVHEWCLEWRRAPSPNGAAPSPPARRASRGGSWRHRVRWSAPAARSSLPPHFRYSDYGFRALREDGA